MTLPIKKPIRIMRSYCSLLYSFGLMLLIVRILEIVLSVNNHLLGDGTTLLYVKAIGFDLLYFCVLGLFFALVYLPVASRDSRVAGILTLVLMSVFLLGNTVLVVYFSYGLTPLGADLYGYSLSEITETARTSVVNINIWLALPFFLVILMYVSAIILFRRIDFSSRTVIYTSVLLILGSAGYLFFYTEESKYDLDYEYNIVANKAGFFVGQTIGFIHSARAGQWEEFDFADLEEIENPEFPLWRKSNYEDALKPYLHTGDRPPNIVFVLVEGLGSSFMGPYAQYGGFTPFLDSLSEESLFWTHFLATSGRSFAVQPSILGSLPYGRNGFMELGYDAPHHQSLISILNQNDYHTAYYAGYDVSFDKLDVFLGRQDIDFIMDQSMFGDEYSRIHTDESEFSWGYSDKNLFRRAFDFIDASDPHRPRLDVYFTLNLHEPFMLENQEYYLGKYQGIMETLNPDPDARRVMDRYPEIFSAILYTDEAIEELIKRYRQRPDYGNTIFIITGDHRIVPINHKNRIDRYWVPFLIYSPLLKQPERFNSVSSHLNVPHTLLSHLKQAYDLDVPDKVHWLGDHIDMQKSFRSVQNIPFIRNKYQMEDYLAGNKYLSSGRLYELGEGMILTHISDTGREEKAQKEFNLFRQINRYVTESDKLMPSDDEYDQKRERIAEEERYFKDHGLTHKSPSELFEHGRTLIFDSNYGEGRIVLRRLLRMRPGYVDARLLYGRSFGWEGEYDEAEKQFYAARHRNPGYYDVYNALADIYFWQGEPDETIHYVNEGLEYNPDHPELLYRLARAYQQKGETARAKEELARVLEIDPDNQEAADLRDRLN